MFLNYRKIYFTPLVAQFFYKFNIMATATHIEKCVIVYVKELKMKMYVKDLYVQRVSTLSLTLSICLAITLFLLKYLYL